LSARITDELLKLEPEERERARELLKPDEAAAAQARESLEERKR